jgi:hypothetical protein
MANTDTLRSIEKQNGRLMVLSIIQYFIIDLNEFFNFNRKMNAGQINQTAQLIYEKYWFYKPEDFVRAFKQMKAQELGKFYEGVDGSKILEMLKNYDLKRQDEIVEYRIQKANEYKAASTEILNNKLIVDTIMSFNNKKTITEKVSTSNDLGNEILREFDKLHKAGGHIVGGVRYLKKDGKYYSSEDYLKLKVSETTKQQ